MVRTASVRTSSRVRLHQFSSSINSGKQQRGTTTSSALQSSFFIHCCRSCAAPHAASWLRIFLRRSGRHARTAVRRSGSRWRSVPRSSHWYSCPNAAGNTSTSQQFQNKPYGSSYGTTYDSLSLGQSSSGYVNNKYGSDSNQGKAGSSAGGGGYWSNALW